MSENTNKLSAQQLIEYIANDYVELSQDKILWQRNDHIRICREWLAVENKGASVPVSQEPTSDF